MTKLIAFASGLLLTSTAARAAHVWNDPSGWWDSHLSYDQNTPKYSAQEVSLDLFGSYLNPEGRFNQLLDTSMEHGFWGGGAGVNYFFTQNLGIGSDFNISSKPDDANPVDYVVGNLYARLPLGNSGLAPYVFGGGGRAMSPTYQWTYGGGVGLEFRFNPTTGVFSDGRFLWGDKGTEFDELVIRAGVRLVF